MEKCYKCGSTPVIEGGYFPPMWWCSCSRENCNVISTPGWNKPEAENNWDKKNRDMKSE